MLEKEEQFNLQSSRIEIRIKACIENRKSKLNKIENKIEIETKLKTGNQYRESMKSKAGVLKKISKLDKSLDRQARK